MYSGRGRFRAHAIPRYHEFYDYENMRILGRVTSGVGAMAFSQQAVNWLAEKHGFKFQKSMKLPERLKVVQAAMEKGDAKALKVYIEIGRFLAHAIPWYNEFYDY